MNSRLRIACAALLAFAASPALAVQLGKIEVKSALNQPLVASIPLHPESLTELQDLRVGLASPEDFARAGLEITPADKSLRFHVVTDNNGQKLILVTSSEPITAPYLDFLVQVDTRKGKQLREFVVLLNPVIEAPAPAVQGAPVAGTPTQAPATTAQQGSAANQSAASAATPASGPITVQRGDTLSEIAQGLARDRNVSLDQMMLALKSANPDAFFKDNINDLKAGAILRIPTREQIDRRTAAEAAAEVHRQYEAWRAAKPHAATVVEGAAAEAAANAAPQPGKAPPPSDHLTLVPPSGGGNGEGNHAGVAGGTGNETVAGLQQQLQNAGTTLASVEQSNADLQSRLRSLEDIAGKSDKLLNMKDATIAELQRKLAAIQSGGAVAPPAAAGTSPQAHAKAASAPAAASPWYERPATWLIAGLVILGLALLVLFGRRRKPGASNEGARGPLADPDDVAGQVGAPGYAASLRARLEDNPHDLATHLALCRLYYSQGETTQFYAAAEAMRAEVTDTDCEEWQEVISMGEELAPPMLPAASPEESLDPGNAVHEPEAAEDPYGMDALRQQPVEPSVPPDPVGDPAAADPLVSEPQQEPEPEPEPGLEPEPEPGLEPEPEMEPEPEAAPGLEPESIPMPGPVTEGAAEQTANEVPEFSEDPVDTKLDLARAYLEMGDPVGARAMLEEVLAEGTQMQKDEANRLLAEVTG